MITNEDIELSRMSYTDKDFASLYPDLLDLAKQLTDLWDPSASNESDPGVVLLKEGAFIADHNNYNIDKNVLECFLPSATQETSVRNLVEMNGYTPRYFISAKGKINIEYKIPEDADPNTPESLSIKPFTLKISNEDGSITYTQGPEPILINKDSTPQKEVEFIEGTLSTLTVNGVEKITLENIDDNNRLYFPVRQVAQNGIFVSNIIPTGEQNYEFWERVDYIYTEPLDSKVFKLDYDSSLGLPYIEFPSDIANLIESGLSVKYIVSSGINGNIQAGKLVKIISPANLLDKSTGADVTIPTEYLIVSNPDSMLNGKDPETIDEMYQSFKKVVHTFNTLVTCKDFQDAIYMMSDENKTRYVGNDIVTDIKTDYNKSIRVVSFDSYGPFIKNVALTNGLGRLKFQATKPEEPEVGDIIIEDGILKWYTYDKSSDERDSEGKLVPEWKPLEEISYDDFVKASEAITPFDICVYALKAFSMADYLYYKPWVAHAKSFEPVINDKDGRELKHILEEELGDLKCLNHQFTVPEAGDIICFKNYVPLWITVIPYSKVTRLERDDIFNNIYKALSENFNSGLVDFGHELNYDEVYNVIVNSDDRIKSIRLEDFNYETYAMVRGCLPQDNQNKSKEWTEYKLINDELVGNYLFIDLVAKNVLAGRLCLFDIDDNFNHEYGQVSVKEYHNIKKIKSEVTIPISSMTDESSSEDDDEILGKEYALLENEYIQVAWPNYYTDITYPQYVYYRYEGQDIAKDKEYKLKTGERLTLVWTQNGTEQRKTYGANQVIKPNFYLMATKDTAYYRKSVSNNTTPQPFDMLNASEQIEHKVQLRTTLNSDAIPVYWITQTNRRLFYNQETGESTKDEILNSGEYFIYSNVQKDAMVIFGAGTHLHRSDDDDSMWSLEANLDIDTIQKEGNSADIRWKNMNFTNNPFYIDEMNLLTLSFGDTIHIDLIDDSDEGLSDINNKWQEFEGRVTYKINTGLSNEDEAEILTNNNLFIRSRLDMTSDKYHRQELYRNQVISGELEDGSTFEIKNTFDGDPQVIPDSERVYYQVNTPMDILGDTEIIINDYLLNHNLDIREFKLNKPVLIDTINPENESQIITNDYNLYINMDYDSAEATIPFSYINKFNSLDVNINQYIIPIYVDDSAITENDFVPIQVWLEGDLESSEATITYKLTHYGRSNIDEPSTEHEGGLILNESGLHLLKIDITGDWSDGPDGQASVNVDLNSDLELHIGWESSNKVAETVEVRQFKIIGGLNKNIPAEYASLEDVTNRIQELMKDSNDSASTPYLTYDPEFSKALQDEDLSNPNTMWDVNNVANPFTIAQIDLQYMYNFEDEKTGKIGTIDIIKSMKDYTE